ncbi:MAG TPA: winged helix-turn-helix domain-containing protein [Streptosporangiaceae bacterium]
MLRFHFTADALLRVRFATGPAPLLDLGIAVAALQRADPVFARWARRTRLPPTALPLLDLIPPDALGPVFLDPISDSLAAGLDAFMATPRADARAELVRACRPYGLPRRLAGRDAEAWRTVSDALRTAHDTLIARDAARVRAGFDADIAWRKRLLAEQGTAAALASVYPGSRWEGSTLLIDVPRDSERSADARGVTLMPSVFWTGRPMFNTHPDGSTLLVYPALTPLPLVDPEPGDALSALLGRTRAAILSLLEDHRTTTGLARALDVSPASASAHTKALRAAGLITTYRAGKSAHHVTTPLGAALLAGDPDFRRGRRQTVVR